jgi:hypothetical protein
MNLAYAVSNIRSRHRGLAPGAARRYHGIAGVPLPIGVMARSPHFILGGRGSGATVSPSIYTESRFFKVFGKAYVQ